MAIGALVLLASSSCASLPEDHALRAEVSRITTRLARILDPRPHIIGDAQRIIRATERARAIADRERRRPEALVARGRRLIENEMVSPTRIANTAEAMLIHEQRRLTALTRADGTARQLIDPRGMLRQLQHAAQMLPVILDLQRQPLPGPRDRNRQPSIESDVRPETWVERIVRRLRL